MKTALSFLLTTILIFPEFFVSVQALSPDVDGGMFESTANLPIEIVVTPLMNRRDLRNLISQVEEDFVKRFNELNIDDGFDIDCYKYKNTRSHIRKKICEPKFFRAARRQDASLAALNINQFKKNGAEVPLLELVQVQSDSEMRLTNNQKYQTLQEKVADLTNSDQTLQILIHNLNELSFGLENYGKE